MTPKEVEVREVFSKRALSELNFQESLEIDHPDKRQSNCTICVHTDRQGPRGWRPSWRAAQTGGGCERTGQAAQLTGKKSATCSPCPTNSEAPRKAFGWGSAMVRLGFWKDYSVNSGGKISRKENNSTRAEPLWNKDPHRQQLEIRLTFRRSRHRTQWLMEWSVREKQASSWLVGLRLGSWFCDDAPTSWHLCGQMGQQCPPCGRVWALFLHYIPPSSAHSEGKDLFFH